MPDRIAVGEDGPRLVMDHQRPVSSDPGSEPGSADRRLESWKDIAAYLDRDVRTVQRWEQSKNLPVHRLPGKHGAVYAWKSELENWRTTGRPESRSQTRRLGLPLVAAVLLAGVALTAVWLIQRQPVLQDAPLTPAPLTSYLGYEFSPSFSPEGTHVAFAWDGPRRNNFDIYVKPVGAGEALQLSSDPAYETSPVWSPDGRSIAFLRRPSNGMEEVVLVPAFGGVERKISESYQSPFVPPGPFLAWTPDSKWLVVSQRPSHDAPYALDLVSVETLKTRQLTFPPANSWGDTGPALSPDGRRLAFSRTQSIGISELLLLSLADDFGAIGEPRRLPAGNAYISSPVWKDDDEIVYSSGVAKEGSFGLFSLHTSLWRLRTTGHAISRRLSVGEDVLFPAFSSKTGRLAYTRVVVDWNIWQLLLADKTARPVNFLSSSSEDSAPKFSPDGKRIVFTSFRSGSMEIWLCYSDGSHPVQLTSFGGPLTGSPAWSPDSKTLAFDSVAAGQPDIYTVSVDGGAVRRLTTSPSNDALPTWSQDGRWIYFVSNRTGREEIWRVSASGGNPVPVHVEGGFPMASPDGRFVYYAKTSVAVSLWRIPLDGGGEELVLKGLANAWSFTIGKKGVYFVAEAASGAGATIRFLSFETGNIEPIATLEKPLAYGLAVSPDEQVLLYTQIDQAGSDLMVIENFR